jgi:hypothetical protein
MATNGSGTALESPFCDNHRSKQYYLLDGLPTEESHFQDASGYCWCFATQGVVGPDGYKAAPRHCQPGRSCYRSTFAADE